MKGLKKSLFKKDNCTAKSLSAGYNFDALRLRSVPGEPQTYFIEGSGRLVVVEKLEIEDLTLVIGPSTGFIARNFG